MSKADYVKRTSAKTGNHHCHWPGCEHQVPPSKWGCSQHWFTLPKHLRDRIWQTFEPGQEVTKAPSRDYLAAADAVQVWIKEYKDKVAKARSTLF